MAQSDSIADQFNTLMGEKTVSPDVCLPLAATLQRRNRLDEARRLLEKVLLQPQAPMDDRRSIKAMRDLIVCTYKDTGLPAETRLRTAERLLLTLFGEKVPPLHTTLESIAGSLSNPLKNLPTMKQDLLGIAGAVEKRRWEFYGFRKHLVSASLYYSKGHAMGCAQDMGYNGINLAFVLDLLSQQKDNELDGGNAARDRAAEVRREIIQTLDPSSDVAAEGQPSHPAQPATPVDVHPTQPWWLLVTLGEAYLGIGDIERGKQRMAQAAALMKQLAEGPDESVRIAPWQLETVARQVVRVAQIQSGAAKRDIIKAPCWQVVQALLGNDTEASLTFLYGKVGLALSGGGFRASLFHIGVLARLAELDVLRHVEVLSCVSGGSILGAHYYLELRNLLQTKSDEEISRDDYIRLVERVKQGFLAGVQGNIRLQMLMGWRSNWRVLTKRKSSTSDRLALLFESELFARVQDGEEKSPRYLAGLRVAPCIGRTQKEGKDVYERLGNFNPKYENWSRRNKVPSLILNATSLNTCHNWQFTASFMGEPPARAIDTEIDANHRLRRMYHDEAPLDYRRKPDDTGTKGIRLGEAVAASACVPGLFNPLHLEGLYGEMGSERPDYMLELVDGGTYDNQGVASLREQDCSVLIISDACGQTSISTAPKDDPFGVMMRANHILMSRSREVQYQLLSTLQSSGAITGLMYLHLKKGLEAQTVDWVKCEDPSAFVPPPVTTSYGIRSDVQTLLAAIRTDLDSFSWLESDALMLSGYHMTTLEWEKCMSDIASSSAPPQPWDFRWLEPAMTTSEKNPPPLLEDLKKSLTIAEGLAFKPFALRPFLKHFGGVMILAFVLAFIAFLRHKLPSPGHTIFVAVAVVFAVALEKWVFRKMLRYRKSSLQVLTAIFMCSVGWMIFYLYMKWIDPIYVNWGAQQRPQPAPRLYLQSAGMP